MGSSFEAKTQNAFKIFTSKAYLLNVKIFESIIWHKRDTF